MRPVPSAAIAAVRSSGLKHSSIGHRMVLTRRRSYPHTLETGTSTQGLRRGRSASSTLPDTSLALGFGARRQRLSADGIGRANRPADPPIRRLPLGSPRPGRGVPAWGRPVSLLRLRPGPSVPGAYRTLVDGPHRETVENCGLVGMGVMRLSQIVLDGYQCGPSVLDRPRRQRLPVIRDGLIHNSNSGTKP